MSNVLASFIRNSLKQHIDLTVYSIIHVLSTCTHVPEEASIIAITWHSAANNVHIVHVHCQDVCVCVCLYNMPKSASVLIRKSTQVRSTSTYHGRAFPCAAPLPMCLNTKTHTCEKLLNILTTMQSPVGGCYKFVRLLLEKGELSNGFEARLLHFKLVHKLSSRNINYICTGI